MSTTIDWKAAEAAAEKLGFNTRRLVGSRDADAAIQWALRMSREHSGVASASYYDLAVMLGHESEKEATSNAA
jgi:hypothetical protein